MAPTLLPVEDFDAETDCNKIRAAFSGVGTDEKTLIDVLCKRSHDQRMAIAKLYKTMFGKDLVKDVKSETSSNFREVMVSLCNSRANFLARICRNAIRGAGTSEGALINVLVGGTKQDIAEIKDAYTKKYKKSLEEDIADDTSGALKHVLVSLLQGNRCEEGVSHEQATKDAKELFNAGKGMWGTKESTFNKILVSRSPAHLKRVFNEYRTIASGDDIENAIKGEMSGDTKNAFLGIVRVIKDAEMYFAEELYKSMKGIGTNDDKLIRLVVWRSEIDLAEIKECFKIVSKGKTLEDFISGDCSGDYKRSLVALC
ncbi:annexin A13-like [Bolinopsis microptera]|uniref:annexin A13-like n=1 Tax=Bolinopsis microptera TaxID=2820187 RepID=UPI003079C822